MKVLVLNSGSSSVKFKLFDLQNDRVIAAGNVERIAEPTSASTLHFKETTYENVAVIKNHDDAIATVRTMLTQHHVIDDFNTLDAIGHRVVHGGETFVQPTRITESVIQTIESLSSLAPLHNPANARGIRAMETIAPSVPQIAVFDTAFHHTMPQTSYRYALPEELYQNLHLRRYGFHGTSHGYVAQQAADLLKKPLAKTNLITLHLGNGASICAIKNGQSVDTSMGLTPLEGLVMGTRSGDVDPGVIFYLLRETNMSADEIDKLLNKQSGLKGVCETNDMRQIEARMHQDERAALAFEMFVHRIRKYVGAYAALLRRLDAIVFTGGIGEHSVRVREAVCRDLEILGIQMDADANAKSSTRIHSPNANVALFVIATNEELSIAQQCQKLLHR